MLVFVGAVLWSGAASAAPGQASRLGGIGPQGPAALAVSALHHNPAMLAALRGAGIRRYSIFRDGSTLFAYCEVEDLERMKRTLADDPTNARWQEYMRDMITHDVDPATGSPRLLPEMFHMD